MSPRTLAAIPAGAKPGRRWRVPRPRDMRIRYKLAALLSVPLIAVVGLAAVRIVQGERRAADAAVVSELSSVSADVSKVAHALHLERMAAAEYLVNPQASPDVYNQRSEVSNAAIDAYTSRRRALHDVPAAADRQLDRIDGQLPAVRTIRREVVARQEASPAKTVLRYGLIMNELVSYREQLNQVTSNSELSATLRTNAAFSKAKWQASEEQATGFLALSAAEPDTERYSSFLATLTGQQESFVAFSLSATHKQQEIVSGTITGDAVELADRATEEVRRAVGRQPAVTAVDLSQAVGAVIDLMRVAEQQLDDLALQQAKDQRSAVLDQVTVDSGIVLTVLLIAILVAFIFSRSMVRALAFLTRGANRVAEHDLPEVVAKLHDVSDVSRRTIDEIVEESRDPIRMTNRDEIGQVATAFNAVHRSAVRVAAEQAALRASVSTMFLNLARRSQSIVDRMIGELDQVERGEDDPARLARLFRLDHLAVRMRRNDENLLVLAGADTSPPRHDDAALADVIRAAQSEIELYERVDLSVIDQDVSVVSHAVNDTARLLAELMDNATRFSPPDTVALVEAARMGESLIVQIADRGIGLSEEQMRALNERLAAEPKVHLADVRMLGLAVVNQLAFRYQISVTLRPNPGGGTIAEVCLPASVLVLPKLHGAVGRSWPQLAVTATPSDDRYSPEGTDRPVLPKRGGTDAIPTLVPQQYTPGAWMDRSIGQPGNGMPENGRPVSLPITVNGVVSMDKVGDRAVNGADPAGIDSPAIDPAAVAGMTQVADAAVAPPVGPAQPESHLDWPVAQAEATPFAPPTETTSVADVDADPVPAGPMSASPVPAGPVSAGPVPAGMAPAGAVADEQEAEVVAYAGDETAEMPIFREMEAGWFRNHGHSAFEQWPTPSAGDPARTHATVPVAQTNLAAPAAPQQRVVIQTSQPGRTDPATPGRTSQPLPSRTAVPQQPGPVDPVTQPTVSMSPVVPAGREHATVPTSRPPQAAPRPVQPEEGWATAADDGWRAAAAASSPQTAGTTRSGLVKRVPAANLVPGGVEPVPRAAQTQRTPERVRGLLSAYHRGVQRGRDVTQQGPPGGRSSWVEAGPWVGGSQTGGSQTGGSQTGRAQVTEETEQ